MLDNQFVCRLHKRMFGDTWRWVGKFRTIEKNIEIDPVRIQAALRDLCDDVKTQLEYQSSMRLRHVLVTGWFLSLPKW